MARNDDQLEWQAWPARERPVVAALAVCAVVGVSVLLAGAGGHLVIGLAAVVVLFGSLNPFFSPTSFRLDAKGVALERWPVKKARAWAEVRAAYADRHGVTLSPFVGRSWLEPYRAVRLFYAGNAEAVRGFVGERLIEGVELVDVAGTAKARGGRGE